MHGGAKWSKYQTFENKVLYTPKLSMCSQQCCANLEMIFTLMKRAPKHGAVSMYVKWDGFFLFSKTIVFGT